MFNFIFNLFSYFVSASCVLLPVSCARRKEFPPKTCVATEGAVQSTASRPRRKEFPLKTCVATEGAVQSPVSCTRRKEIPPKTCVATEGGVASKGGRRHGIRQHGIIFTVQRYGEYSMQIRIFFPIIRIFIQNAMHIS